MKLTIYLFTILLTINACKSKKEAIEKETATKTAVVEEKKQEMIDAEREAAIVEQMKNEKMPSEGEDYYKMVSKEISADAVARIQRTACFGRCPIYTLTVFKDGRVEYFGKKFTPREGKYESNVAQSKIDSLMNYANEASFFRFENVYDKEAITDLPSTIISVRNEEGMKTVVDRFDAPEELKSLEKLFDNLFLNVEWTPVGQ